MTAIDPDSQACLERTRSAVLNILLGVGAGIALSGLILRWRDRAAAWRAPDGLRQALIAGLIAILVVSHLARRIGASRSALREPAGRSSRFYRAHVLAAAIGALAVPLGLAFGWAIRPRLDAVAPFWIAALALGFLALPKAAELEDLDPPTTGPGEPTP